MAPLVAENFSDLHEELKDEGKGIKTEKRKMESQFYVKILKTH